MKLRDLGEDRLVAELIRPIPRAKGVVAGPGDDCAVVRISSRGKQMLLKTDCVVEGVHFESSAAAGAIGWKAMARPLSDFAAMSGRPLFALITFIAPPTLEVARAKKIYAGLQKAAVRFQVAIVGGETCSTPGPMTISVSVVGEIERSRSVSRRGAKVGDELFVTGRLGGSIAGRHLRFVPRIEESRWLTEHFSIHAMMDLSDGLGADLPRLAHASGLDFSLDEAAVPRTRGCDIRAALSDGEDYELLFALSPGDSPRLQRQWRKAFPKLALTRIGVMKKKSRQPKQNLPRGYVHFA